MKLKMSLRKKQRLIMLLEMAAVILFLVGVLKTNRRIEMYGVLAILAAFTVDFKLWRCPHCTGYLGRHPGKSCRFCGKEVDYDAVPQDGDGK